MNLKNVGMNVSPLTGKVMLIRVGKNKCLALDQREAESDLYRVLELLHKHYGNDFKQDFKNPVTNERFSYTVKKLKKPPTINKLEKDSK